MDNLIKTNIQSLVSKYEHEFEDIRAHLHANPELSFKEFNTSAYVKSMLTKYGIAYTEGYVKTGILGEIVGKDPSRCIVLRADMDALPIVEANDVPYKSKNNGIMHACGHDVHMTCVLGAARILSELNEKPPVTVLLLFQPGEEKLPGGASLMLKEGIFENRNVIAVIGQHVHPPLHVGKVGIKAGMYMASADEIYLTVKGKGGHAALPQNCVDPILLTANILTSLQEVTSRYANPTIPTVLTFGKINSTGGATNIIPDEVKLEGTLRTMDEEWRNEAHGLIKQIAEETAKSRNGSCEVEIKKGYPYLQNHPELSSKSKKLMEEYLGEINAIDLPIRMTAEDFAYYSQEFPAVFYRLGTGNPKKGITSSVHTDTFDIDLDALKVGSGLMAYLAHKLV